MICPEYDSTDGFRVTPWFPPKTKPEYSGIYQVQAKLFSQVAFYCWYNAQNGMWLGDVVPSIHALRKSQQDFSNYRCTRPSRYQDYVWRGVQK